MIKWNCGFQSNNYFSDLKVKFSYRLMNWFLETKMPLCDPLQNVSFESKVIICFQIFFFKIKKKKKKFPPPKEKTNRTWIMTMFMRAMEHIVGIGNIMLKKWKDTEWNQDQNGSGTPQNSFMRFGITITKLWYVNSSTQ